MVIEDLWMKYHKHSIINIYFLTAYHIQGTPLVVI